MKKVNVFITVALLMAVGVLYYLFSDSRYELAEEMYDFPVPIGAKLIAKEETEFRKTYDWSPASGDNGIPLSYKLIIKKNGWKQGQIDGTNVIYSKGSHQINLNTSTNYLCMIKVE
ncbi:hypothetical protein ACIQ2D_01990 [Lysinibacillus sp. NPDC097287]|uniref:hypothetical protein n=1 Tax=Lysinibacillus sp. NPDC097287 TaxID=3364144 RepID=UPI00380E2F87